MKNFLMGLMVLLFVGCNNTTPTSPEVVNEQSVEEEVHGSVQPTEPNGTEVDPSTGSSGRCDLINVVQRRVLPGTNRILLEVEVPPEITGRRIKIINRSGNLVKLLEDFPVGEVFEIGTGLPCGQEGVFLHVYAEGYLNGTLHQCDGGVTVEWECEDECTTCECRGDCPPPPCNSCECDPSLCPPPPCQPTTNPPCETCVWSSNKCKWKCDCPEPDALVCHVSNKGKDGNWNLQEQTVKLTPGHTEHLDASKFCPPDYLGECDGRYDRNPHPCMLEVQ